MTSELQARERRLLEVRSDASFRDGGIAFTRPAQGASGTAIPQTRRNVALGGAIGAVLGLAIAWSSADRRSAGGASSRIGLVTGRRAGSALAVVESPASADAQTYDAVLSVARFAGPERRDVRTMTVTGDSEEARSSEVATNLAALAAEDGSTVLLVTFDGELPAGAPSLRKLERLLDPAEPIEGVVQRWLVGALQLYIVSAGAHGSRTLRHPAFVATLARLLDAFDLVIFDVPAVGGGGSALAALALSDVGIGVTRDEDADALLALEQAAQRTGVNYLGHVVRTGRAASRRR